MLVYFRISLNKRKKLLSIKLLPLSQVYIPQQYYFPIQKVTNGLNKGIARDEV